MGDNHKCGERNEFASHLQHDHSNYSSHKYRLSALESHLYSYLHKCSSNSTHDPEWLLGHDAHTPLVHSFGSGASLIKHKQNAHFHKLHGFFLVRNVYCRCSTELYNYRHAYPLHIRCICISVAYTTCISVLACISVVSNTVAHAVKRFCKKQPIFVGCFSGCLFQRVSVSASARGNSMATNIYCVY